ncbi:MAG: Gfo/Idh/MocA family oxidoreductase, partial [Lachnospiraceae bacterium]|nr:Gfo/Idh/MocA family oxidoreductase [Lachnospiraceae bacterium]
MKMFQIAIIGPGAICRTYMEALNNSEKVKVTAISGRDTEKGRSMAAEYGLPYYVDQE